MDLFGLRSRPRPKTRGISLRLSSSQSHRVAAGADGGEVVVSDATPERSHRGFFEAYQSISVDYDHVSF